MNLNGTKTKDNLMKALIGESLARNKYTFYATAARKEGLTEAAEALERMANNEMMHAQFWFQQLNGPRADTRENLKDAAAGEFGEWRTMYPDFAKVAREEGLEDLAYMFERVASIEKDHEYQFMALLAKLSAKASAVDSAEEPEEVMAGEIRQGYRCQFCGAVYSELPDICDACQAVGAFEPCTYRK